MVPWSNPWKVACINYITAVEIKNRRCIINYFDSNCDASEMQVFRLNIDFVPPMGEPVGGGSDPNKDPRNLPTMWGPP